MLEANKRVVRRHLEEVFGRGDASHLNELVMPGARWYRESAPMSPTPDAAAVRAGYISLRTAFPDLILTIEDIIAEGDTVAVRAKATGTHKAEWNGAGGGLIGVAPSGKSFNIQLQMFYKVQGGRIVERRIVHDWLGMLEQLDAWHGR